jgi:hypothetical protein
VGADQVGRKLTDLCGQRRARFLSQARLVRPLHDHSGRPADSRRQVADPAVPPKHIRHAVHDPAHAQLPDGAGDDERVDLILRLLENRVVHQKITEHDAGSIEARYRIADRLRPVRLPRRI